jgi:hypothetical protein
MRRGGSQTRALLATISTAPAPDSRYAKLVAETLLTGVRGDLAEERFTAASTATALSRPSAWSTRRAAVARRLAEPRKTGERHCGKAEAEPFKGLPPRARLRYSFGQLIKSVIHRLSFLNRCSPF